MGRAVNSRLGEMPSTSVTADSVTMRMSSSEPSASESGEAISSTTVERRSSSSGWLRSMRAARRAGVSFCESGRRSETRATAATAPTPASHVAHRTRCVRAGIIASTAMLQRMAKMTVAATASTPRTTMMRRMRAPACRSLRAIGRGSLLNGMSGMRELASGVAGARLRRRREIGFMAEGRAGVRWGAGRARG